MILSNNILSYANEITRDLKIQIPHKCSDMNSIINHKRVKIEQEILEKIKNNSIDLSETKINPMGLPDIDPVTNPASDNWLTREVAKQIGKDNITKLTQDDFNKIKYIFLQDKKIESIPEEIGNLFNLTQLHLSNNKIKKIPEFIYNLTNLKSLGLNSNEIEYISPSIGNLKNLWSLGLENNKIKEIPEALYNLINLEYLILDINEIKYISPKIDNLKNLNSLALHNNKIKEIPESLYNLVNLHDLNLGSNEIEYISPNIDNLKNLELLSLYDNKIKEIPEALYNLVSLELLSLESNEIEYLSSNICNLKNLGRLWLTDNKIKEIPESLYNLTNLYSLYLNFNKIEYISPNICNLKNLDVLDLKYQNIDLLKKVVKIDSNFSINNPISLFNSPVVPSHISHSGFYDLENNIITWQANNQGNYKETFNFEENFVINSISSSFSGVVTQPIYTKGENELDSPNNLKWADKKAVWEKVYNNSGYEIQLFKDNQLLKSATSNIEEYDFTDHFIDSGNYSFKVKAIGNNNYTDSEFSNMSDEFKFINVLRDKLQEAIDKGVQIHDKSNVTIEELVKAISDLSIAIQEFELTSTKRN